MAEHEYTPTKPELMSAFRTLARRTVALGGGAFAAIGITAGISATAADLAGGDAKTRTAETPHPDNELIAIGREAEPLLAEDKRFAKVWWTLDADSPDINAWAAQWRPIDDRLFALMDRARELKASTLEGLRVKAMLVDHALSTELEHEGEIQTGDFHEELAWSLVRDLLGRA